MTTEAEEAIKAYREAAKLAREANAFAWDLREKAEEAKLKSSELERACVRAKSLMLRTIEAEP